MNLFNTVPIGLALLDRTLKYVYINECLAAINGRPPEAHRGLTPREVIPEISRRVMNDLGKVVRTGKASSNLEIHGETPATPGKPKYWRCTYCPITSRKGAVQYVTVLVQDVTERRVAEEQREKAYAALKQAQSQLIRSEKLASIGMLVSGVTHELNNPLNVIFGNLKLLDQIFGGAKVSDGIGPARAGGRARRVPLAKVRQMVGDSIKASYHAHNILQDFRQFARDTRGADVVDVNDCFEDAWSLLAHDTKLKLTLVRRLKKLPQIPCVRGQVTQVFLNLLVNAAEATDGKGTITVTSGRKSGHIVFDIADNGRGIPEELGPKLFEPFFTTKTGRNNLGLGLSISSMIAHHHGGQILVLGRHGKGARFRLILPQEPPR